MKLSLRFITGALFLCISMQVAAQKKFSTVKIFPPADNAKFAEIISLLEIDHYAQDGEAIVVELGQNELAKLHTSGTKYKVLIDDTYEQVRKLNKQYYANRLAGKVAIEESGNTVGNIITTPSSFEVKSTFGGYYSFAEMEAAMDALVTAYPGLVTKTSLGKSTENRDIWCIKISDNVATDEAAEPDLLYVGLQHAREAITGASMIFFMQYLAEQYASNSKIKSLVDNREFYIIPCMNPDGWEYNRVVNGGVGGDQRKNRRNVGNDATGQKGVDLNRNWGEDWANCSAPILGNAGSCGSSDPSATTYYGPSAFSEPETRAIRDLAYAKNFVLAFDQHAYGPYYSLPYGRRSLHGTLSGTDALVYKYLSAEMGKYNGMRANDSYGALGYEVAGGFKDWMLLGDIGTGNKGKVYGLTGEGGAAGASNSFWPAASQIINLCKGMCYQNLQMALFAGSYVDLQDVSNINVTALTGNFSFKIRRIGLSNLPVTVTLIPLQGFTTAGSAVTVNSLPNYDDSHTGQISYTLPGATVTGQKLRFAWKVETGGQTYYDTITKFYNPTVLLADDMEGTLTTNWSVPSGGSAANKWGFTSASSYSGSKSLAETMTGNYSANESRIVTTRNTFDVQNATSVYLSFWVKHRTENFRDKMRVEVSTNGTTWLPVTGRTTIQEPGTLDGSTIGGSPSLTGIRDNWTKELFDLSAYSGAAALRFRFNFTSDGDASSFEGETDDGFYIDDVALVKSAAPSSTLPVSFLAFEGRYGNNNTILLNWETSVDPAHDYFVIEKSLNRQSFTAIGEYKGFPAYQFTDHNPVVGSNYYRIKQIDKDGHFTYSKIIEVSVAANGTPLTVFPNPVMDQLQMRFYAKQKDRYLIRITNVQGMVVKEEYMQLNNGVVQVQLNVQTLNPQLYLIRIFNSRNEPVDSERFIKK